MLSFTQNERMVMREIVLDTETTGLDPFSGDKIVEIGCVELINHVPTGVTYQKYLNPQRSMSEEVIAVHGLTEEFLSDKPIFEEIADDFLEFIGSDSILVIHNAPFDMKFLNCELAAVGRPEIPMARVCDTLVMARQKYPGSQVNLNALCKRFDIDLSAREKHGALLDSELLAEVYLELLGGREPSLVLKKEKKSQEQKLEVKKVIDFPYRSWDVSEEDIKQHIDFVEKIKNNLWQV